MELWDDCSRGNVPSLFFQCMLLSYTQVLSGEYSYKEVIIDISVILKVGNGVHPSTEIITDEVWGLLTCCWDARPKSRPTFVDIATMLRRANHRNQSQVINRQQTTLSPHTALLRILSLIKHLFRRVIYKLRA